MWLKENRIQKVISQYYSFFEVFPYSSKRSSTHVQPTDVNVRQIRQMFKLWNTIVCKNGISDILVTKNGPSQVSLSYITQSFQDKKYFVIHGSECKCLDLSTPIHTLLPSTFFRLNLNIQYHTLAFGSFWSGQSWPWIKNHI